MGSEVIARQTFKTKRNGSSCPAGSMYVGNGFCRSKDHREFFLAGGSGSSCPLGSKYKGNGFCQNK